MSTYSDPTALSVNQSARPQFLTVCVFLAGLLALGIAGYFYWQTSVEQANADSSATSFSQQQNQLAGLKSTADQLALYADTAKGLHSVFDNQKNWQTIMSTITAHMYKHMAVSTLQVNDAGTLSFTGTTSTFTDYAVIYASLTSDELKSYFATVKPTGVSKTTVNVDGGSVDRISFGFDITLNQNMLKSQ